MKNIIEFIEACTDSFHTTTEVCKALTGNGYTRLNECDRWELTPNNGYFVTRNMSSVIAFRIPDTKEFGYMIAAAHGDSPSFKIKASPELTDKKYIRLNVEGYGGMKLDSWLDRPLSVSGRIIIDNGNELETKLINLDRDSLIIPSVAIHLDRSGEPKKLNIKDDMPPLYALSSSGKHLIDEVAEGAGVTPDRIKGFDLTLYNRESGRIWGVDNEFISAPRLDDLQCVYALLDGFLESKADKSAQVLCVLDNEEVGSGTRQGAKSDFLKSTLLRINEALGRTYSEYMQSLCRSFMVSADNGHAIHPNHPEVSDPENAPVLGGGIVIKHNASQRYTTDAVSEAVFKKICENADVPYQTYANRSDIPGGSTLGNLAAENVCINTVDIGLAQLSMHSAFETAGAKDTEYLASAAKEFFSASITEKDGIISF